MRREVTELRPPVEPEQAAGADAAAPLPWPRMVIALLSLVGIFLAGYLLLHHFGIIGRLACGQSGSCETVQASRYSVFAGIPVPAIGLAGYGALLVLALAGLRPEFAGDRRIARALAALTLVALGFSAYLSALEAYVIHAWCRWCIASAVVVAITFVCALVDLATVGGRARAAFTLAPGVQEEP